MARGLLSPWIRTEQQVNHLKEKEATEMKALLGMSAAATVLALAGADGLSSSMLSLAALAAGGCWVVSGWIIID